MFRCGSIRGAGVSLSDVNYDLVVTDYSLSVTFTQIFVNNGSAPVEAVYEFMIQENSSVCGFSAEIDSRVVTAKVMEKEQARNTYDDAIASGGGGYLLEETKKDEMKIFTINIGNLPPGKSVKLNLKYITEAVVSQDGQIKIVLPKADAIPGILPNFALQAQIEISTGIDRVTSPTHTFEVHSTGPLTALATLQPLSNTTSLQDLEIYITPAQPKLPMYSVQQGSGAEKVVMVTFSPQIEGPVLSEMIFLVDCSGSMEGVSIANAKETLRNFLRIMPHSVVFNIIEFGSDWRAMFESSAPYSDSVMQAALNHVDEIEADMGGTNLVKPLQHIFQGKLQEGVPRQLFILTDGAVESRDECFNLVRKNAETTRVFTFGIGSSVDIALVRGIAKAGEGEYDIVKDVSRLSNQVMQQLSASLKPALSNISCNWGTLNVEQTPFILPPVFSGSRIIVYGYAPTGMMGSSNVTLTAMAGKTPISISVHVDSEKITSGAQLFSMFTRSVIRDLEESRSFMHANGAHPSSEEVRRKTVELSCKYNILSNCTSFVAVERRDDAATSSMLPIQFETVTEREKRRHQQEMQVQAARAQALRAQAAQPQPQAYAMSMGCCAIRACAPPPTHSMACYSATPCCAAPQAYYSRSSATTYVPPPKSPDIMKLRLPSNNSWKPSLKLMKEFGLKFAVPEIPACLASVKDSHVVWMTALVLVFLRRKYPYEYESVHWKPYEPDILRFLQGATTEITEALRALAPSTAVCRKGHTLMDTTQSAMIKENSGYSNGYSCDLCGTSSGASFTSVYHCTPCGFDVCPGCIEGNTSVVLQLATNYLTAHGVL